MNSTRPLGRGLLKFLFLVCYDICMSDERQPDFMWSFHEQISSTADGGTNSRDPDNYDLFLATEVASFMK